jgi:hypothetical protein
MEVTDPKGANITGISYDTTNGIITVDNTSNLGFGEKVVITVTATVRYPYGSDKVDTYTVTLLNE